MCAHVCVVVVVDDNDAAAATTTMRMCVCVSACVSPSAHNHATLCRPPGKRLSKPLRVLAWLGDGCHPSP
jgi:hypothetical protein